MPPAGLDYRAGQLAFFAGWAHERFTDAEVGGWIARCESWDFSPDSAESANVREWRRGYDRATKVPRELVEEIARTQTLAHEAWVTARAQKDFAQFRPWLEKIVDLERRVADCIGYAEEAYDALLDAYEPGMTARQVAPVLGRLREQLAPLVRAIAGAPRRPDVSILHREYPVAAQEAFAREVAAAIGFDFARGRLDVVAHPFCTELGPCDVRITTRYDERFFSGAFFGVIHEAGHGIYEQNLPAAHWGTPLAASVSLGIHESQSRLWENFVGRSRAFWEYWFPRAQQRFTALAGVRLDDFVFAINAVQPSFIRVEADEATYNLHILLRFELERALIRGELKAADLPAAWNENFEKLLGLKVPDDAMGCLQDVHWSGGLIGYFPTYALGNLNAAQLMEAARAELGDVDAMLRAGEFAPLREWLTRRIHCHGMRYRSARLIEVVTGRPLDEGALLRHLNGKFGELYGLSRD